MFPQLADYSGSTWLAQVLEASQLAVGRAPSITNAATGANELARHKRQKRSVPDEALTSFVVNEVVD